MPPTGFNVLFEDFQDRLGIHFGVHIDRATGTGWTVGVDGSHRAHDGVSAVVDA